MLAWNREDPPQLNPLLSLPIYLSISLLYLSIEKKWFGYKYKRINQIFGTVWVDDLGNRPKIQKILMV